MKVKKAVQKLISFIDYNFGTSDFIENEECKNKHDDAKLEITSNHSVQAVNNLPVKTSTIFNKKKRPSKRCSSSELLNISKPELIENNQKPIRNQTIKEIKLQLEDANDNLSLNSGQLNCMIEKKQQRNQIILTQELLKEEKNGNQQDRLKEVLVQQNSLGKLQKLICTNSSSSQELKSIEEFNKHAKTLLKLVQERGQNLFKENEVLKNKLETNKIFLYMVIHDLKHPAESLKEQLGQVGFKIAECIKNLEPMSKTILEGENWNKYNLLQKNQPLLPVPNSKVFGKVLIDSVEEEEEEKMIELQSPQQEHQELRISDRSMDMEQRLVQIEEEKVEVPNQEDLVLISNRENSLRSNFLASEENMWVDLDIIQEVPDENFCLESYQLTVRSSSIMHFRVNDRKNQIHTPQLFTFNDQDNEIILENNRDSLPASIEVVQNNQHQHVRTDQYINNLPLSIIEEVIIDNQLQLGFAAETNNLEIIPAAQQIMLEIIINQEPQKIDAAQQTDPIDVNQFCQFGNFQQTKDGVLCLNPQEIDCLLQDQGSLTKTLQQEMFSQQKLQSQVTQLQCIASMMMNLLQDLLDLAQMEKNTFTLNNSYFSLYDTINQAFGVLLPSAALKSVKLVFKKANRIERAYYQQLFIDQRRVLQILVNFVSNAIKFSPTGGQVTVSLNFHEAQVTKTPSQSRSLITKNSNDVPSDKSAYLLRSKSSLKQKQLNEDEIHNSKPSDRFSSCISDEKDTTEVVYISFDIVIEDNGMGIPQDKLNSLFVNFSKIKKHKKTNPSGVGLGLSICKDLIEQMGGQVKVLSQEGVGSQFIVTMKCKTKVSNQVIRKLQSGLSSSFMISLPSIQESVQQDENKEIKIVKTMSPNQQVVDKLLINQITLYKNNEQVSVKSPDTCSEKLNTKSMGAQIPTRCLIANDDTFQLSFIAGIMSAHFLEVDQAVNGLDALQFVQKACISHYDLIILDINMPIMGGREACTKINDYLINSRVTNIVQFGYQAQAREKVLEHFNIRRMPVIVALTADVSDTNLGKFSGVIHDLQEEQMSYLLKLALLKEKDIAWKSYIKQGFQSNLNFIQESSNRSNPSNNVSVDSSQQSNIAVQQEEQKQRKPMLIKKSSQRSQILSNGDQIQGENQSFKSIRITDSLSSSLLSVGSYKNQFTGPLKVHNSEQLMFPRKERKQSNFFFAQQVKEEKEESISYNVSGSDHIELSSDNNNSKQRLSGPLKINIELAQEVAQRVLSESLHKLAPLSQEEVKFRKNKIKRKLSSVDEVFETFGSNEI